MEFNLCLKNKIIDDENLRWVEIYRITNVMNNKVYIGQAVSHRKNGKKYFPKGTEGRFKEHICESTRKQKYHCNALNNAIRTYGFHNFIVEHLYNCKIEEANESVIKRQIPLIHAWAITIHKAQGMSLEYIQTDIGQSIFEYGQAYVVLSRIRSLEGLSLINIDYSKIKAHPKIIEFYNNLK